jgi:hypothetical protein
MKQDNSEPMYTTIEKAMERPKTKFNGKATSRGLKYTLNSHIFLISLSVQVSSSWRTVETMAALSNCILVTSLDSLYLSAALSLGGSSYFV